MLWCIGLVILVQVLKKMLISFLPAALLFHTLMLTGLQVAILLFTILHLLFTRLSFFKKILLVVLIISIPGFFFNYWLQRPSKIPVAFKPALQKYYTNVEVNIIQFNPNTSSYDSLLFYTLKPSASFVFNNREFADSFQTNSKGLRDDEVSLVKPPIICLGDSYAMGWGVKQHESFAEQMAMLTNQKVLNAAVSSYSTGRELECLSRLNSSNLQYLIIQYCRNDNIENKDFVENNYTLRISSREKYDSAVNKHYWTKLWFPGKRVITISKLYAEKKWQIFPTVRKHVPGNIQEAARYFTDILMHSGINFKKTKVLVVDVSEQERMNDDFVNAVNKLLEANSYKERFSNNLIMVPLSGLLNKDDYYILDLHIRASGHRKIAERLSSYIISKN